LDKQSDSKSSFLRVTNLSVLYSGAPLPVIANLNLDVLAGETIGIIGVSGSGKTTLAKAILNSLPSSATASGSISYSPKRPLDLSGKDSRFHKGSDVSLLAQEPWSSLNPAMSIKAQFRQAILAHHPKMGQDEVLEKTKFSLSAVGLDIDNAKLKHYPKEFSGGQQQRICIALSLLHEPKLLIADEPTSSLDQAARNAILNLLFQKQSLLGNAIVLISHDSSEVFSRCSKVYKLENGSLTLAEKPVFSELAPSIRESPIAGQLLVSAKNLGFWRLEAGKPRTIFEGLNFDLAKGQRLGVSGVSGAGKSTLARVLTGLEKPGSGELMVLGKDLFSKKLDLKDRANLALVFQDSGLSLNPRMTVEQILLEPLRSQHVFLTKTEQKDKVATALADVGLNFALAESYPRFLSGGQRQRINIARSLMLSPELLIADEPASALDYGNAHRVLSLLDSLQAKNGFALLLISHDHKLLEQYTDRVLEIKGPVREQLEL
jgi:ABC-type glutathione transport system ATPase component